MKAILAISHPHWDHIQGFPFFKPAFISGNEFTIIGAQAKNITLRQMIASQMDQVYFPIQLSELKAKIRFRPIKEETIRVFDATLSGLFVNHPAFALGYRLDGRRDIAGVHQRQRTVRPGSRPLGEERGQDHVVARYMAGARGSEPAGVRLRRGADVLIHDATYTPEEYVNHVGWGHSHYLFTLKVASEAGVKKLVLFHHDQTRTDEKVDEILQKCQKEISTRNYTFRMCRGGGRD